MGKMIKFAFVNDHGDFPALLDHYGLNYTKSGDQLRLICPFHDDSDPSLSITLVATEKAQANTFHCFGCKASGSIIDFANQFDGEKDLRVSAMLVAELSGSGLAPQAGGKAKPDPRKPAKGKKSPPQARKGAQQGKRRPEPEQTCDDASESSQATYNPNPPLKFSLKLEPEHPYLEERLSQAMVDEFEIGFLPKTSKSMMAGRICVPINDEEGNLVAYVGRVPKENVPDDTTKYLLPPNFKKSELLFNLDRLGDPEHVVLVEGVFDAIRLHELGIPAVALIGTSMSDAQVKLLAAAGVKRVLVLLDCDAGGEMSLPALLALLTRSFFVHVGTLPDGCDPEEASDEQLRDLTRIL